MPATTLTTFDLPGGNSAAPMHLTYHVNEAAPAVRPSATITMPVQESAGWGTQLDLGTFIGGNGYDLFGGGHDNDELMMGRYGGSWQIDRVTRPDHAPPGFFSEVQIRQSIAWVRWLVQENHLGIGFGEAITNFVGSMKVAFVRRGAEPGESGEGGADPLVKDCQRVWDEWCEASDWGQGVIDRERECCWRLMRDGMNPLRFGPGDATRDFLPWVRHVEPEQVRFPTGRFDRLQFPGADYRFGRSNWPRDPETILSYWICDPDNSGDGEEVPACEIVESKGNVDRVLKVGLSDFHCVEGGIQVANGLLSNTSRTARAQAAIAWIQRYATATPDQITTMLRQVADGYTRVPSGGSQTGGPSMTPRYLPTSSHPAGTVIHADQNREFDPGPVSTGISGFLEAVDGTLKGVSFRFGMPDWFAAGSASSFAAALVTGSQFVRSIEARQERMAGFTRAVVMKVLELAERSGLLSTGTTRAVRAIITPKPVVIADEEKQARVASQQLKDKLISPQEIIRKEGRDSKTVAADIKAWEKEFPQPGSQPAQPLPSRDPIPAPPGSAGGDGGSPNEPEPSVGDLAAESIVHMDNVILAQVCEAGGLVQKEVEVHRDGKVFKQKRLVRPDKQMTAKSAAKAKLVVGAKDVGLTLAVKVTKTRAFTGEPVVLKTPISKQDTGKIGEAVIVAWLKSKGMDDAGAMNIDRNNFPIDLIQDHETIEAKTGLASNSKGAQQWRLTIGQPGKEETAWLATASAEEKAAWNAKKQKEIHARKQAVLDALSKEVGKPIKAATVTVILNPDTKTADIYKFTGWHDRIAWGSEEAKAGYVESVTYA